MSKKTPLIVLLFCPLSLFSQWTTNTVDNDFDEPYKTAYTKSINDCFLQIIEPKKSTYFEKDSIVAIRDTAGVFIKDTIIQVEIPVYTFQMLLVGGYFCKDRPDIDIVFYVNGEVKNYTFKGHVFENRKGILVKQLAFEIDKEKVVFLEPEFIQDFKSASKIKLRVNDTECDVEVFEYTMGGSAAALDFLVH